MKGRLGNDVIYAYVAAVVRVSTDAQARLGTIKAQEDELPKQAARLGFEIREWIKDDGASGRRLDGRNLLALLKRIEDGSTPVTAIFAVDLHRLVRPDPEVLESLQDYAYLQWVLGNRNVPFIDLMGNVIRLDSLEGKLRADVAGEQLKAIRTSTRLGRKRAAALNRPASGFRPYGFRWVKIDGPQRGHWEIHDEHAAIVVFIFATYLSGTGAPTIARILNERGVPTPMAQREANKAASGKRTAPGPTRWQAGTILTLMKNRAYLGRWSQTIDGETYVGKPIEEVSEPEKRAGYAPLPRLVSDETFERAQAIMEGRGNRRPPRKMTTTLLSGCATCGHCGHAIVSTSAKLASGKRKPRYVCCGAQRRYSRGIKGGCALGSFNADEIDEIVWSRVAGLLMDSDALAVAASLQEEATGALTIEKELRSLETKLKQNDDQVQKNIVRERRGLITDAQLDAALEKLKAERLFIERNRNLVAKRLEKSRRAEAVSKSMEATLDRLRVEVRGADAEKRNQILRALCPTRDFGFTLRKEGQTIEFSGRICLEVAEGAQLTVEVA